MEPITPESSRYDDAPAPLAHPSAVRRRRAGARARFAKWYRRWARETFSRESLIASLKSLMYVAPLTLLIWIYAEREQLLKVGNVQVRVALRSADPKRVVTLLSPPDGTFYIEMSGPRGRLEGVQEKIDPRMNALPIQIDVPGDLKPGQISFQVTPAQIGNDSRLSAGGVTVSNIQPRVVEIRVDEVVERELPVRAPPEVKNLQDAPIFTPAKVRVMAPQSFFDELRKGDSAEEPAVYADAAVIERIVTPGPHERVPVRVGIPGAEKRPHVIITPDLVTASLNVKYPDRELTLPRVPVFQLIAPTTSDDVKVDILGGATLGSIRVIGPDEQIDRLSRDVEAGLAPVVAFVKVSDNDPVGQQRSAEVSYFGLPTGVRVAPADEKRKVTYQLVKRGGVE